MSTNFTSTFADDLQNFLKLQEALDFNPESYRPRLKQFDAFITQRGFPLQTGSSVPGTDSTYSTEIDRAGLAEGILKKQVPGRASTFSTSG